MREPCDLIMKGGITSGVVYPAAVKRLSDKYDFVAIGGASAGAIAAAVTAAAQYARSNGEDGFARLDEVRGALQQEGLLPRLFQPTKETRPLLELLLGFQAVPEGRSKVAPLVRRVLARLALPTLLWGSVGFAFLAVMLGHAGSRWASLTWPAWVVLGLLTVLGLGLAFLGQMVVRLYRAAFAYLPSSNFGMVLGLAEGPDCADPERSALTEWLYEQIQRVAYADRSDKPPLTFGDLSARGIDLLFTTTDLSWTRPARLPCPEAAYYFSVDEFRALFPEPVLAHLIGGRQPEIHRTPDGDRELLSLPGADLPVVVGVRMSLSFPILLAAVPLWAVDADGVARRHWFSDGGISSNFPIHFFDAWVPTRPTFGLDLVQLNRSNLDGPARDYVKMYPTQAPPPTTVPITSLFTFARQIVSTMQDWHDTLQSELAGFHDRIAHVELSTKEGGLNIMMPKPVIEKLDDKGTEAGERLVQDFCFEAHQDRRYEIFMGMLQDGLTPRPNPAGRPSSTVSGAWASGLADRVNGYATTPPAAGRTSAWYAAASTATTKLLADAGQWLGPGGPAGGDPFSFRPDQPLAPPASMRVTPDV